MSLRYSSFLQRDINWTDDEISIGKKWLNWEDLTINWEDIDLSWEEIFILLEVQQAIRKRGGGSLSKGEIDEYIKSNPWDVTKKGLESDLGKEKTEQFIKLVCKVNGIEYEEISKPKSKAKITADHIQRTFKVGAKVGIKMD
jgi:hypothetical protein